MDIIPFCFDIKTAAFRIADWTMQIALRDNLSLEEASLELISQFEKDKGILNSEDQKVAAQIVALAVQQLQDVWEAL